MKVRQCNPCHCGLDPQSHITMNNENNRTILCGANAYETKYHFNEQFANLPKAIQDELRILCVLFTEEVGGIFTIWFESDGTITLETDFDEDDIYYDEISSGLMVNHVQRKRKDLFESLEMYYHAFT